MMNSDNDATTPQPPRDPVINSMTRLNSGTGIVGGGSGSVEGRPKNGIDKFKASICGNLSTYKKMTAAAVLVVFVLYAWVTFKTADTKIVFLGVLLGCLTVFNAWLQYDSALTTLAKTTL